MVIDFAAYAEKKRLERETINAEASLVESRLKLARAYAEKGLKVLFEENGYEWSQQHAEMFIPLMEQALVQGLTAAEIETMVLDTMRSTEASEEEIENDD